MARLNETSQNERIIDELFCPECTSLSLSVEEQYGRCTNQECSFEGNVKKCKSNGCLNVVNAQGEDDYCVDCIRY